jgi:hypothetical protein
VSPEAAALVGVGIGAILSLIGSLVVNERSQTAERKRLEMQFAESVQKEQRDAARKARSESLQPALDFLTALEQAIGSYIESIAVDDIKARAEKDFGPISDEAWETTRSQMRTMNAPSPSTILAEFYPKIMGIQIPDLEADLKYLLLTAVTRPAISGMDATQRNDLLAKMRNLGSRVNAEIIRGDWP